MMRIRNNSQFAQIFILGLILAVVGVYFPPYARAWVGDDYVQLGYILDFVQRPFTAYQLFNPTTLGWYYRPLQNVWFLANRLLFGLNPAAFYWQMVLWHALATALVYRTARQWGIRPFAAACATALFAIHGHYVDVVAWVSSVAIVMTAVFSLLSLSFYLEYLHRSRSRHLALTFLFFLLALFSHEEAILLPIFFLFVAYFAPNQPRPSRHSITQPPLHLATLALMVGLTAVVVIIQFTRPNLTIDISQTADTQWLALLSPAQISRFISDTAVTYTMQFPWESNIMANSLLFSLGILLLLGAWAWAGNRVVRLGLLWLLLHLALIYAALWAQKPNLFAGRHFYNGVIGFAWAVGATFDLLLAASPAKLRLGKWRVSRLGLAIAVVMGVILLAHISAIRKTQQAWLGRAERDAAAEQQLKAILPAVGPQTHVFANRFPITPQFFRAVTEVWYDLSARLPQPVGSFAQLQLHGRATRDFYVFDYEAGRVFNLMPELQLSDETIFLWSNTPRLDVVDEAGQVVDLATAAAETSFAIVEAGGERRFTVKVAPVAETAGWLSVMYVVPQVPAGSDLRLAFRSDAPGATPFRVRLIRANAEVVTLAEGLFSPEQGWAEVMASLAGYGGESVVVRLETAVSSPHTAYWANPRLAIDD
ncbi:MAG: hypothetical protein IPM39_02105 [Chloroflexi bacterium]|nr:hypothetical protein [Chloroflexota bacterium]